MITPKKTLVLAGLAIVAVLTLCLWLATRKAEPFHGKVYMIEQKDQSFLQNGVEIDTVRIKAGDELTFVNDDVVTHNIYSRTSGDEFEIPKQKPGAIGSAILSTPGNVEVRCAIHPKMKLNVLVEPADQPKK